MQRWIKLHDGRYLDASRIMYIGKVESFPRYDEEGNDLGLGYSVNIGTELARERHITIAGSKEEILGLLKNLLGATSTG